MSDTVQEQTQILPIAPPGLAVSPDDPRLKLLKPQQRIFAMAYGFPGSTTFGNALQSYKQAYPHVTDGTAGVQASRLLDDPKVSRTVAEIINSAGLGIEVRADQLKRIISHRDIGRVVSRVRKEAEETVTETQAGPSFNQVLKAVDVANKMDGLYSKQQGAVDIAVEEYRSMSRRFFPRRAKAPTEPPITSPVASVEAPASDAAPTPAPRQGRRAKRTPKTPAPQGAGGEGRQESRASVVLPSPTAGENLAGGDI